ncbi:hypothetical protein LTR05_007940 [Lithohypha guttulata]|uniref:Mediator complex subunit 27 n=1 Tax=Lithohypha guttulata TaxID=1690604 RepID=A0AAN7STP1_9EURO|nr:hypothetical protein LTR05_007940 [Lithohypha guttulata]
MASIVIEDIHPEDIALYEALALTQQAHSLLNIVRGAPSNIIGPLREACSTPQQIQPQEIAYKISKGAQKGRHDIQELKQRLNDDRIKPLLKEASNAELVQGYDTWTSDYLSLAKKLIANKTAQSQTRDIPFDTTNEATTILDNFANSEHELTLKLTTDEYNNSFPLTAKIGYLKLVIDRGDNAYSVQSAHPPNGRVPSLSQQVAEVVSKPPTSKRLSELLEMLEAYHDIDYHRCESCHSMIGTDFSYPLIRKAVPKPEEDTDTSGQKWLAYHEACMR